MLRYVIVFYLTVICCFVTSKNESFATVEEYYSFYKTWSQSETSEQYDHSRIFLMSKMMDTAADPCENFYQFSCGNYNSVIPENNSWYSSAVDQVLYETQEYLIRDIMASDSLIGDTDLDFKLKSLYKTCVDDKTWSWAEVGEFVEKFASWPIMNDTWSENDFDWLNVTANAASYGLPLLFKHTVELENDLYYDHFGSEWNSLNRLQRFKEVASKMSITLKQQNHLDQAIDVANELIRFQNDNNHSSHAHLYNISDLQPLSPNVDLIRFMKMIRGSESKNPLPSSVLITPDFYKHLSNVISTTHIRDLANYMFVEMILTLEEQIDRLMRNVNYMRESSCAHYVREHMKSALDDAFTRRYFKEMSLAKSSEIIRNIQTLMENTLTSTEWKDTALKMQILDKLSSIKSSVLHPHMVIASDDLHNQYQHLIISNNSFIQNALSVMKLDVELMLTKITNKTSNSDSDPLEVDLHFRRSGKGTIEIPIATLQPPIFHRNAPSYQNLAGFGSNFAEKLIYELGFSSFSESTQQKNQNWTKCISSQLAKYNLPPIPDHDASILVSEFLPFYEGVKIALHSYKQTLTNKGSSERSANLEINGRTLDELQLFFVAFAQARCTVVNRTDDFNMQVLKVEDTLMNSGEFSEAFHCSSGSRMNPPQKCMYFGD